MGHLKVHKLLPAEAKDAVVPVNATTKKAKTTWIRIRQIQLAGFKCAPDCVHCVTIHGLGKPAELDGGMEVVKPVGGMDGEDLAEAGMGAVDEEEKPVETQKEAEEKAKQEEGGEEEKQLEAKTGDPEEKAAESDGIAVIGEVKKIKILEKIVEQKVGSPAALAPGQYMPREIKQERLDDVEDRAHAYALGEVTYNKKLKCFFRGARLHSINHSRDW